ncbi:MAG TPA: hypothetical protein VGD50_03730, partial [Candidatus Baltobacteraceae bacterium]
LACTWPAGAFADGLSTLVVGSVRDQSGVPLDSVVEASDASGHVVGRDRTQADGTFSILVEDAQPVTVTVRCRFCADAHAPVGTGPIVILVHRYEKLTSDVPSASDIAALPYAEVGDALGLGNYMVPTSNGTKTVTNISEGGLGRGRGLVLDDGVPVYDLADGSSGLADFPSHDASAVVSGPERAFTYGSYASGGTFALAPNREQSLLSVQTGLEPSLRVGLGSENLFAGAAFSENADQVMRRRGDLSYDADFAGGRLQVQTADAALVNDGYSTTWSQNVALGSISYETASRHYRTFVSAAGATMQTFALMAGGLGTRASDLTTSLRVEHPGLVELAYGAQSQRLSASLNDFYVGRVADDLAYVEGRIGDERTFIDLGASLSELNDALNFGAGTQSASTEAGLGSLSFGKALGHFDLSGGASSSLRIPTLGETSMPTPAPNVMAVERGDLVQAALDYDDAHRIRVGAVAFHEALHGFGDRDTEGLGFSVAWQIAPLITLRSWSLDDDVAQTGAPTLYSILGPATTGRGVLWSTYDNPLGLRVDAIVRRDVYAQGVSNSLDGDLVVPLGAKLQLTAGSYRENGLRRASLGMRF